MTDYWLTFSVAILMSIGSSAVTAVLVNRYLWRKWEEKE